MLQLGRDRWICLLIAEFLFFFSNRTALRKHEECAGIATSYLKRLAAYCRRVANTLLGDHILVVRHGADKLLRIVVEGTTCLHLPANGDENNLV